MSSGILVFLLIASLQIYSIAAGTDSDDFTALKALKDIWQNLPPNWVGTDPCGSRWEGIGCTNSRVTSITLPSMGLKGSLSGDISAFSELLVLDLSYNKDLGGPLPTSIGNLKKLTNLILVGCGFSGTIPESIGSLGQLVYLSLNSNGFTGPIPPSIGRLSKPYWLDLADNKLNGPTPISKGTTPGLDMLHGTKHFHFGMNQLSGPIPPELFSSDMILIHLLLDSNNLTGSIPSSLVNVQTLEVVRLDRNSLTGPVPSNFNNLTSVSELLLSNNALTGLVPNLTGMNLLTYLVLSNNSFEASVFPPWISNSLSSTTLMMENTKLQGEVPTDLFSLSHLQKVVLKNNQLNGTLDMGTSFGVLQLVDLQENRLAAFAQRPGQDQVDVILLNNPVCQESGTSEPYCTLPIPEYTIQDPSHLTLYCLSP